MLESLACGTPVVAFDVGGIPDGVKNGRTGVTAALGDYDRLAQGIRQLLTATEDAARRLRDTCRTFALENFALGLQAMRYHALYKSLAEPVQRPSLSH
jgi:glycosyltransferase involved in cell wall biosynthesis